MATPTEWLNEFQVNTGTAQNGTQSDPKIIGLANGNFLVAWTEAANGAIGASPGADIVGQLYDPEGAAIGNPFQINATSTNDDESDFDIAATNDGGFILVYVDESLANANSTRIRWERFNDSGIQTHTALIDSENAASESLSNPQVAVNLTDNTSVVAYTDMVGSDPDLIGRSVSPTGMLMANYPIGFHGDNFEIDGDLAILDNGDYVYVLEDHIDDRTDIVVEVGSAEAGVGGTVRIFENGRDPQVTSLTNGNFVVTWEDLTSHNIRFQIRHPGNSGVSNVVTIQNTADLKNEPQVVALPDGDFVIVWDDDTNDILQARRFNSNGSPDGSIFTVENAGTTAPDIGVTGDGRILFTWVANNGTGEIFASIWDPRSLFFTASTYDVNRANFVRSTVITARKASTTINGDSSDETILGQSSHDTLNGGNGDDTIEGGAGNDTLNGGNHNDLLLGGFGSDTINGGNHNDTIEGGFSTDTINGGQGNDLIRVLDGEYFDNVDGGSGTDTLDHSAVTRSGDIFDFHTGQIISDFASGTPTLANIEIYQDGSGSNTIVDRGGNFEIFAQGGNDLVQESIWGGVDSFDLGAGNDTLEINTTHIGGDSFDGGLGFDLADFSNVTFDPGVEINLATGTITHDGNSEVLINFEQVEGSQGGETIIGSASSDSLSGNDGDDTIIGGNGNDILVAGAGADTLNGSHSQSAGAGEVDIIDLGKDTLASDRIVLGDEDSVYYSQTANEDYAVILNFDRFTSHNQATADIIDIKSHSKFKLSHFSGDIGRITINNGTRIRLGSETIAYVDSDGLLTLDDFNFLAATRN